MISVNTYYRYRLDLNPTPDIGIIDINSGREHQYWYQFAVCLDDYICMNEYIGMAISGECYLLLRRVLVLKLTFSTATGS